MMTETEVEEEFLGGCYNTLNNKVLANLVKDTMHEIPQEPWTDEEIAFAKALNEQSPQYKAGCAAVNRPEGTQLYEGPMEIETANSYGSTEAAKAEFDQEMAGKKYVCPIPAEVPVPYTK